ncbi:IclR family transcriptional regulator [Leekyejoonella antrihumi]|uniref:IclR family transcriptional regulator n=1 Tax=Leekyejoonella antrihumi TaxID=1660198 RepID=A0A563DZV7_9MICO|nr:IclR family transcriptional regulator [Leekyejoonella antrihumi]TWP35777.1 IclR family transcriptional regulator [Leekyejoonella antrihumi]
MVRLDQGGSFQRGLSVLVAVAEAGEARAEEIVRDTELPLSTVYRYLRTLRTMEFVEERDGSYVPGWRLLELSGQQLTRTRLVELGHSFLRELSESTGETAVLTVRVGTQAMCLRQVESRHPIRMAFKIGQLLPLYAGAGQRMLLAHAPETVVERILDHPLRHFTTATMDREHILHDLQQIRRSGFLVSHGELSEGAVAVAAPVFADGEIACSITVAGPKDRCSRSWVKHARGTLLMSCQQLAEVFEQHPSGQS